MSFVAIHRDADVSLATDQCWLSADEWRACSRAVDLLDELQALKRSRAAHLEQAAQEAHEAGYASGRAQALRETVPTLWAAWQQAATTAQTDSRLLRDALVALSTQVVWRITAELGAPEVVDALVRRACQELVPDQPAVVRVHPDVAAILGPRHADGPLEVRADASLALLDCVFDTHTGQLLAGLATQLERVTAALRHDGIATP